MTKVLMLKTAHGSLNGFEVVQFLEGKTYDLPDDLIPAFIEQGAIKLEDDQEEIETKPAQEIEQAKEPLKETKVINTRGRKTK